MPNVLGKLRRAITACGIETLCGPLKLTAAEDVGLRRAITACGIETTETIFLEAACDCLGLRRAITACGLEASISFNCLLLVEEL